MSEDKSVVLGAKWPQVLDQLQRLVDGLPSVSECQRTVTSMLPNPSDYLGRNARISGSYAAMYLRNPDLFKWCGMAAFASHHVRKLILVLNAVENGQPLVKQLARLVRTKELETLRQINNAIHNDIYWAHVVYGGREEGLAQLKTLLDGTPRQHLYEGFATIERGRQLQAADSRQAEELIWEGNISLLWHEQQQVVQPMLSDLSSSFSRVFSMGSSLSYEPRGALDCMHYCSSFYLFMVTREPKLLMRSGVFPRLNRLEQRWAWIQRVLVPNFRLLETDNALSKIENIAAESTEP